MSKINPRWLTTLESCEGADQLSVGMPDRLHLTSGGVDRHTDRVSVRLVSGAKVITNRFDLDELISALASAKQQLEEREKRFCRPHQKGSCDEL